MKSIRFPMAMALKLAAVALALGFVEQFAHAAPPGPVCTKLADGTFVCPDTATASKTSFVWTTPAPDVVARAAPCDCGLGSAGVRASSVVTSSVTTTSSSYAVAEFERRFLFPRARAFVSSVADANPKPLRRLCVAVISRFRR